jgi:DnaK suppressor protein
MAKATKTPTKSSKASVKEAPKKNGKSEPVKAKAKESTRPAKIERPLTATTPRPAQQKSDIGKPNPDASTIRAHGDAKLTKPELTQLFNKLVEEKARVLGNFEHRVDNALAEEDVLADEIDIAQRSTDQAWLFRMADKDRKLLIEIEAALEKMHSGEYGVCEGTDEPIGFKRLELRPWTRYSVGYKEMLEREKAQQAR